MGCGRMISRGQKGVWRYGIVWLGQCQGHWGGSRREEGRLIGIVGCDFICQAVGKEGDSVSVGGVIFPCNVLAV